MIHTTIDTYFAPNKTIREINELIKSGAGIDPLKNFSEAASEELLTFSSLRGAVAGKVARPDYESNSVRGRGQGSRHMATLLAITNP
jgi:hypothetical protein